MIQLQEGKHYMTRDGQAVYQVERNTDKESSRFYSFKGECTHTSNTERYQLGCRSTFTEDGRFLYIDVPKNFDLVQQLD